jgi:anti-anti-sigma regulatory factor
MDVILVARRLFRNMRKRLILCRVRPEVARMMAICQLDTLVQSCESLEEAEDQLA